MIPIKFTGRRRPGVEALSAAGAQSAVAAIRAAAAISAVAAIIAIGSASAAVIDLPSAIATPGKTASCLSSGDGYLRAHLAGAIDANIDWPNSGTTCEGESRDKPPGVTLSFQRAAGSTPNLLLLFGLTGVRAGKPAHAVGVNLTVIMQGKSRIFGTLGDTRCTVDSLTQRPLAAAGSYRLEARGFCTQPAHAIRGDGDVLVSTFEFAGLVNYYQSQVNN
jgi:hypothetical protein